MLVFENPCFLWVDLDYVLGLPLEYKVSVAIDDGIRDLVGGYCTVRGKIFYSDGCFDYYRVKCFSRKRAREVYRLIRHYREVVV